MLPRVLSNICRHPVTIGDAVFVSSTSTLHTILNRTFSYFVVVTFKRKSPISMHMWNGVVFPFLYMWFNANLCCHKKSKYSTIYGSCTVFPFPNVILPISWLRAIVNMCSFVVGWSHLIPFLVAFFCFAPCTYTKTHKHTFTVEYNQFSC